MYTVQKDNKTNLTQKQPKAKKLNVLKGKSQSPDLNQIEQAFYLLKTRLKVEKNKEQFECSCSKGMAKQLKVGSSAW